MLGDRGGTCLAEPVGNKGRELSRGGSEAIPTC